MAIIYQQSSPATGGWADEYYRIYVSVDELSRDQAANTSTQRIKVWMVCSLGDYNDRTYNNYDGVNDYYLKVNGSTLFSGTKRLDFRESPTIQIGQIDKTFAHAADGSLSLAIDAYQHIDEVASWDYARHQGTATVPTLKKLSVMDANPADVTDPITFDWIPEATVASHDLEMYVSGNKVAQRKPFNGVSPITLTAPELAAIYALTGSVTSFVIDYKVISKTAGGAEIGSTWDYNTNTYKSTVIPTFTGFTYLDEKQLPSGAYVRSKMGAGNFLQHLSNVAMTIAGAAGASGSAITGYEITWKGTKYNTQTVRASSTAAETISFTGRVKDSRGRWSASGNGSVTFMAYSYPRITEYKVLRALVDGTVSAIGTYTKHFVKGSVCSVIAGGNQKNQLQYTVDKVSPTPPASVITWQTVVNTSVDTTHNIGAYSVDSAYMFILTIKDAFEQQTQMSKSVAIASVPLEVGIKGVSVGDFYDFADPIALQITGTARLKNGAKLYADTKEVPLIIDQGGTGLKGYRKYSDGQMEQWTTYSQSNVNFSLAQGSGYYAGTVQTQGWSLTFYSVNTTPTLSIVSSAPDVIVRATSGANVDNGGIIALTSLRLQVVTTVTARITAIGRWKA